MASGNELFRFSSLDAEGPSTNFGTPVTSNGVPVLAFDDDTVESREWSKYLPAHYGGGGITIKGACFAAAITGNFKLDGQIARMQDGTGVFTRAFASAQTSGSVVIPGTTLVLKYFTIAFTSGAQMDSLAAEEWFRFKLARDPAVASDLSGDLFFWKGVGEET